MQYRRLILFRSENDKTLDQVKEAIERDPQVGVSVVAENQLIVNDGNIAINVWLDAAAYVPVESGEIAEEFAAGRPDRNEIAACDRRFVLVCDPYPDETDFNTLFLLEGNLESLVGGKTFDPNSTQFT